jgi:hypothetical protein
MRWGRMESREGWIEVTVLADGAEITAAPGRMTLALARISSLGEPDARVRAAVPGCGAQIVLAESLGFAPWVFRAGDDEPPAPCRVLAVAEPYEMLKALVAWAAQDGGVRSRRDWEEYLKRATELERDLSVGAPLQMRQGGRRTGGDAG